jgi:predicted RND superfamily exporter protein
MRDVAAAADGGDVSALAVGIGTLNAAEMAQTSESILTTLLMALAAVTVLLTLVYRALTGSATLGALTAVPIALVTALVVGGMWLLSVPLTLLTSLMLSLIIGLGIDYNIHVSDRFAQELDRGLEPVEALRRTVQGTGGALLGSVLTSGAAFATLLLHPSVVFRSFGQIVVLALALSFVVSVLVLPSFLLLWARWQSRGTPDREQEPHTAPSSPD